MIKCWAMKATQIKLIQISVISVMAFVLYSYSFKNDFVWDDLSLIRTNDKIQHLSQIPKLFFLDFFDSRKYEGSVDGGYYRPLILASFALDYAFWKENPFGYHLTNLLLHLLNAMLVFWLARRLLGSQWGAFWIALFFAIHPLQVDAVAYISGRTDVLATTFILGSLLCFLSIDEKTRWVWLRVGGALLFHAGALLSKEIGLLVPAFIFIACRVIKKWPLRKTLLILIPFLLVTVGYLEIRSQVLNFAAGEFLESLPGVGWRFLSILIAWASSSLLFFWPSPIYFERFQPLQTQWSWQMGLSAGLFVAVLLLLIFLWKKNRPLFFLGSFYFLGLLPVLQIHPMYVQDSLFWTEHFFYLPSIGFFAVSVAAAFYLILRFPSFKRPFHFAAPALILLFSFFTILRTADWKNEQSLYENTLRRNPNSARAHNNLALVYESQGKYLKAVRHFKKAIALNPHSSGAYNNLGNVYKARKKWTRAIACYRKALRVGGKLPCTFHNLAQTLIEKKDLATAEKAYLTGIAAVKNPYALYNQLGMLYLLDGRKDSAMLSFQKALELRPDFVEAFNNAGILLAQNRQYKKAEEYFQKALALNPGLAETHNNLGNLYYLWKRFDDAEKAYRTAKELAPEYEDPLQGLERLARVRE